MDDLIVIILTLIVAVVGALGQIKKKKNAPQPESGEENQNDFWSFMENEPSEEEVSYNEAVESDEMTEPTTFAQEVKELNRIQDDKIKKIRESKEYDFTRDNEGKSIYKEDLTADSDKEKKKKQTGESKIRDFSLRKAVIYSEILNRKYQ